MADELTLIHLTLPTYCVHDGAKLIGPDGKLVLSERLAVTSAEATEHGWKIAGGGEFLLATCPSCNQAYSAIQRQIPVQVSQIQCPRCRASQSLDYSVTKVALAESTFSFEATLTCPHCKKRNAFKKVLGRLADILSIEIGLTGITLKAKGK